MAGVGTKKVSIIGFPVSLGANRRGSEKVPTALRNSELFGKIKAIGVKLSDLGDAKISKVNAKSVSVNVKNITPILNSSEELSQKVFKSIKSGAFPISVGGDHTVVIGSVLGASRAQKKSCGLIYFDAHGDFNTPKSSPSHNFHGMTLAFASGLFSKEFYKGFPKLMKGTHFLNPKRIVIIGARSLDKKEKLLLKKAGVTVFTMLDIDREGIESISEKAVVIASKGNSPLHVSLDLDVLDPAYAPGTNTPVVGGLSSAQLFDAINQIKKHRKISSFDISEANFSLDKTGTTENVMIEAILEVIGKDPSESLL